MTFYTFFYTKLWERENNAAHVFLLFYFLGLFFQSDIFQVWKWILKEYVKILEYYLPDLDADTEDSFISSNNDKNNTKYYVFFCLSSGVCL